MNKNPTPSKRKKQLDGEAVTALFLLALTLFLILIVPVFVFRSCEASKPSTTPTLPTKPPVQTTSPPTVDDTPVFSGGASVAIPNVTDTTATVTDQVDSYYALLIDLETGNILAHKNSDISFSPASMTKVMTLIVACENLTAKDLQKQIPLTYEVVEHVTTGNYAGTEISLPQQSGGITCIGDTYSIKDLLYGIGVSSAADCSYMIALEVAGSEEAFVRLMNEKARELGLTDTQFDNVVGFDSTTNVTTARDMAVIMSYAMQSELIADILRPRTTEYVATAHWEDNGVAKTYAVRFKPSYKSRFDKYPAFSLTGVNLAACKTGYTTQSYIVSYATSKTTGARYVLVLGDRDNGIEESITQKLKNTMIDMETMFNTYIP